MSLTPFQLWCSFDTAMPPEPAHIERGVLLVRGVHVPGDYLNSNYYLARATRSRWVYETPSTDYQLCDMIELLACTHWLYVATPAIDDPTESPALDPTGQQSPSTP